MRVRKSFLLWFISILIIQSIIVGYLGESCNNGTILASQKINDSKLALKTNSFDYLGIYSFTNDAVRKNPAGWIVSEPSSTYVEVDAEKLDRNKVVQLYDNSYSGDSSINNFFGAKANGTIEVWFITERAVGDVDHTWASNGFTFNLYSSSTRKVCVQLGRWTYMKWGVLDGATFKSLYPAQNPPVNINQWYHLRIEFAGNKFIVWVDGVRCPTTGDYTMASDSGTIDNFFIQTGYYSNFYVDAVDYSWAPGYYTNRNMEYEIHLENGNDWVLWMIIIICGIAITVVTSLLIYRRQHIQRTQPRIESTLPLQRSHRRRSYPPIAPQQIETVRTPSPHYNTIRIPPNPEEIETIPIEQPLQPPIESVTSFIYCTSCGARCEKDQLFCTTCGSSLD
ncbi:MAG TPA: hypothetical protein VMV49_15390 [Candidatus Deferrimicrobium sp.]|nr:hypothetical protein [Candidatus Deferrimicrobium sp.]